MKLKSVPIFDIFNLTMDRIGIPYSFGTLAIIFETNSLNKNQLRNKLNAEITPRNQKPKKENELASSRVRRAYRNLL